MSARARGARGGGAAGAGERTAGAGGGRVAGAGERAARADEGGGEGEGGAARRPINVRDYEEAASRALSRMAYDYYRSGAHDEITVRENEAAFRRIRLRYRVLRDVSSRDLRGRVLGREVAVPVLVAPTGFHGLACAEGEVATAGAAGDAGTILILSTLSNRGMEEVAAAASGPVWFQLYVYRDRGITRELVARAEAAGCEAIVLTVDAPLLGTRERDVRNRFRLPEGLEVKNLLPAGKEDIPGVEADSGLAAYVAAMFDPSLSWEDLEWLCGITDLPVLVKGVVHPDDGRLAVEHGAAGVVVSNHGGRQLDTAIATIEALPEVAEAVEATSSRHPALAGGRPALLMDGGIRRGSDVLKALALGADAVCVGRPVLWGLAVEGRAGAARVLGILREELDLVMALCGCTTVEEVRRAGLDLVRLPPA